MLHFVGIRITFARKLINMKKLAFLALLAAVFGLASCKKSHDQNEGEVITTLRYTLTPVGGGTPVVLSFVDLDGDGGAVPVITGGTLMANTSYQGSLLLLNQAVTPVDTISNEIEQEAEEHQFFFQKSSGLNVSIAYADLDADNHPIGLLSVLTTSAASSGNLTITLRHEPNKHDTGAMAGNITNAGGETDIEVAFPITIN